MIRSPTEHEKWASEPDIAHWKDESTTATVSKKRKILDNHSSNSKLDQILALITNQSSRLDDLESHIRELKSQACSIQTTNADIVKSVYNVTEQITQMQTKIDVLEFKRLDMSDHLGKLEDKIERIERYSVKTSIEIRQVPKNQKENRDNLFKAVENLSIFLDLPLDKKEVRDIYRLPSRSTDIKSTVVVEFVNSFTKQDFLICSKKKNQTTRLTTSELGFEGKSSPIYISEHLTTKARHLHYLARDVARTCHFAYCWTAHGQVFLRKDEEAPHLIVKSEAQLNEIKNQSTA